MKYFLLAVLSVFLCFSFASAVAPLKDYTRITSKAEIAALDAVISKGAIAALSLAAEDGALAADAATRYQVDKVKYVASQAQIDLVSYFAIVTLDDTQDASAKGQIGYVVDQDNATENLTLRAYKVGL